MIALRLALVACACGLLGTCQQRPDVLEQVRTLGELRVATRNSPTAYYLGANGPEGPEFELASRFAQALGVSVSFVPHASPARVYEEVARGRAHLGAAGLAITPQPEHPVEFSPPYQEIRLHVVYRRDRRRPERVEQLAGLAVEVVSGTAQAAALAEAAAGVDGLTVAERADVDALELLDRVADGSLDATVVDANEYAFGRNFHPELRIAFSLDRNEQLAWALPRGDAAFAARVRSFFDDVRPEITGILARYYGETSRLDYVGARHFVRHVQERLPRLRTYFEQAAAELGEDWRLIAAIGYQESKWDPAAVSPTGVRGVMMLTAETAQRLGVTDREDPRQSVFGGARYLQRMRDTMPGRIPEPDRTWFALAAYNIGYGHLEDARVLAQQLGRDPDAWHEVREVLPLLAQERHYTKLRRGYARGWEAARFVDNVRGYLDILEWLAPDGSLPSDAGALAAPGGERRDGTS